MKTKEKIVFMLQREKWTSLRNFNYNVIDSLGLLPRGKSNAVATTKAMLDSGVVVLGLYY